MNNPVNDPNENSDRERFASRIVEGLERRAFNFELRGSIAEEFGIALQDGRIHEVMISDALGHPVAYHALNIFMRAAQPGSFDPADADLDDFPVDTTRGVAEQNRYNSIVKEIFRDYTSLELHERREKFGVQPADLEPELRSLLARLDSGRLSVADLLDCLTSR